MGWNELRTKKNIGAQHRERMANNEFNTLFNEVEIDDSYHLERFMWAEIDFEHVCKHLNLHRKTFANKITFRVRKIKSNAIHGRYYNSHRTLVVSTEHMDSFTHELGHLLDYEWLGKGKQAMLSEQENFNKVYDAYIKHYTSNTRTQHAYYKERTEVFARCLECYVARKFGDLAICPSADKLALKHYAHIYPVKNEEVMDVVDVYFDLLFRSHLTAVK